MGGGEEGRSRARPERSTSGMQKVYSNVRKRRRRSASAPGGSAANVVGLSALGALVCLALVQRRAAWSGADRCHCTRRLFLPSEVAWAGEVVNLSWTVSAVMCGL